MIYALPLTKTAKNPFPYERTKSRSTEDRTPAASPTPKTPEKPEVIDFDGIEKRAVKGAASGR